jgi:uncharacterized protein YcgI (DUF1989 family)
VINLQGRQVGDLIAFNAADGRKTWGQVSYSNIFEIAIDPGNA